MLRDHRPRQVGMRGVDAGVEDRKGDPLAGVPARLVHGEGVDRRDAHRERAVRAVALLWLARRRCRRDYGICEHT
jgi:hypothetical protein